MGKSTAAKMFRRLGVPVHDADHAVHRLLARGGAGVRPVAEAFPGVVSGGAVDRRALGDCVFGDAAALRKLEAILHPLVQEEEKKFLAAAQRRRAKAVVLEIPLLFETGADRRCDVTVVVSAPPFLQKARVLRRPGMTEARFNAILARQMSDSEKRARADVVVRTGLSYRHTLRQIARIVRLLAHDTDAADEKNGLHRSGTAARPERETSHA
jgi:dephospho-CoA kinase